MKRTKMNIAIVQYILLIAFIIVGVIYYKSIFAVVAKVWKVSFPLVLGMVIAYVLNIIMKKIEKIYFPKTNNRLINSTRRGVSILISLFLIVAIIVLLINLIVPELINAFIVIGREIPVYFEIMRKWLLQYADQIPVLEEWLSSLKIDWSGFTKNAVTFATTGVGGILNTTFSFVGVLTGGIINFVIALIFAIYILISKEKLQSQIIRVTKAFMKKESHEGIGKILRTANQTFSDFIVGQCTEAVILGVLCTLGMLLFRFPYAPMIGTFIGVTALVPIVGAYLGAGLGVFMILTVDPLKALLFLVFILVLQQLEGNLIYPKVVGSSIGLPGIWVLAAVTIGGGINGIVGMLFGVPLVATGYKLLAEKVITKETAFRGENKDRLKEKEDMKKVSLKKEAE